MHTPSVCLFVCSSGFGWRWIAWFVVVVVFGAYVPCLSTPDAGNNRHWPSTRLEPQPRSFPSTSLALTPPAAPCSTSSRGSSRAGTGRWAGAPGGCARSCRRRWPAAGARSPRGRAWRPSAALCCRPAHGGGGLVAARHCTAAARWQCARSTHALQRSTARGAQAPHQVQRVDVGTRVQQVAHGVQVAVVRGSDQRALLHLRQQGRVARGTAARQRCQWRSDMGGRLAGITTMGSAASADNNSNEALGLDTLDADALTTLRCSMSAPSASNSFTMARWPGGSRGTQWGSLS